MKMAEQILEVIQWVVFIPLSLSTLYILLFAIAGIFRRKIIYPQAKVQKKFLVLIPCYKEDTVILNVAKEATQQNYDKDKYDVVVIADKLKDITIEKLRQIPVKVIEVKFDKSSKSKSINYALSVLPDDNDYTLILDADNVMEANVLTLFNDAFSTGYKAIQGHRTSKNTNTNMAILDSISEEINNHIFRRGHRALGLSSALIGSGMAFDSKLYKKYMATIESFGEDKELENKMLRDRIKFEFLDSAYILDEKVAKSEVFVQQRSRWIFNQFNYAKGNLADGIVQLLKHGKMDYFDKIIQHFLPPRILMLGVLVIITLLNLIFRTEYFSLLWIITSLACMVALLISVPAKYWDKRTALAILYLPASFFLMAASLLKMKQASQKFVHTTHSVVDVGTEPKSDNNA